jgi:hypothetical protein
LPHHPTITKYLNGESLSLVKDKEGVILQFNPFIEEPDRYHEDFEELMEALVDIRAELLAGDLRPLYLMHLAVGRDGNHNPDEVLEAPVPAMLHELSEAQVILAEYLCLEPELIFAAAEANRVSFEFKKEDADYSNWLKKQSTARKHQWLVSLMEDTYNTVRTDLLAAYHEDMPSKSAWPTVEGKRTISELERLAKEKKPVTKKRKK